MKPTSRFFHTPAFAAALAALAFTPSLFSCSSVQSGSQETTAVSEPAERRDVSDAPIASAAPDGPGGGRAAHIPAEGKDTSDAYTSSTTAAPPEASAGAADPSARPESAAGHPADRPAPPEYLRPEAVFVDGQFLDAVINDETAEIFLQVPYRLEGELYPLSRASVAAVELAENLEHTLPEVLDLTEKTPFTIRDTASGEEKGWSVYGGYQIPGSDFSRWHSERVAGFITIGTTECDEMPGESSDSLWDNGNPAYATTGSKKWPTQRIQLPDGTWGAQLITRKILGIIASGNMFTGRIERDMSLKQLLGFTDKNGRALIDWGIPFECKPKGFKVKFSYDGKGDECSLIATLENRTDGGRRCIASAGFIGDADTEFSTPACTISAPDNNGLRTLEAFFVGGDALASSGLLAAGDVMGAYDEPATHVNVVFASSAKGDEFKGVKDATLIIKDFAFIF